MVITYHKLECVKIQFGDTVLVFNPPSKKSSEQSVRFSGDVVLSSIKHEDFYGVDTIPPKNGSVFVIDGPGEYEVKGVFVKGFPSKSNYDKKDLLNTIYTVKLEDMNICFLGALNEKELSTAFLEDLEDINVLFVPIGGDGVLDPVEAYKLAVKLAPNVIIPVHYDGDKDKMLSTFLKEEGNTDIKPIDKFTIKKKEIEQMEGEIVVLASS
ncbi:hypothetical protein COW81_01975 [Candidatus Campbellbacteria bacterium CG22_combo_CG10-13_8_21_14_all_36_13]|uniref:Zn-dependent hydrolase n=1 Tax=Candidatus Campbellbacteria bacterium CG22_combo_CG10-13_8_21_14_all_36_13 TaxID=1974529 RepID=A0A2H0DY66_9BACT|nr:MAG: hypothetical protein COW81_01975 [Candidatus Campbellbacteria bacterium CG22_combo_CG10-13_8_21_14_all_36_13]